jgi:type I restriction enzyme M protein
MAEKIDIGQLEQWLWGAANILRGPVDASDFKAYIFPMLFLKRLSDVFDEEKAIALAESNNDEEYASLPELHRFQIPEGSHWLDIRKRTTNVGQAIQHAIRSLEQSNPTTLFGIFGDVQWTNKNRLPDRVLVDLVDQFSKYSLSNENVDDDLLGVAYEYLIKKFADLSNKKAGEYYTPRSVIELMVKMINPQAGETIYDPACGTGGMLLTALEHVKGNGGDPRLSRGRLFGQEKNVNTSAIARINLILHGAEDFNIAQGDTLRDPRFFRGDQLADFDCVLANPPFSLKQWGHEEWESDRWGRNQYGTPPESNGDLAWVQHMIKSMKQKNGRLAVVLPLGTLFREGSEGVIRRNLIEADLIETVIELAPNLFYGATVPACILIIKKQKNPLFIGKIRFIDARKRFRKGRNQNTFEPNDILHVLDIYANFNDVAGESVTVTNTQVLDVDGNLSINRWVKAEDTRVIASVSDSTIVLNELLSILAEAELSMNKIFAQYGISK